MGEGLLGRCLGEDATDPDVTSVERLALVRDRVARIPEVERELEAAVWVVGTDG